MPRLYFNLLQYLYTRRRSKFPGEKVKEFFLLREWNSLGEKEEEINFSQIVKYIHV